MAKTKTADILASQRKSILARRRDLTGIDVRRARDLYQVTQRELAAALGISTRSLIRVEQQEKIPRLVTAALIGIGLVHPDNMGGWKDRHLDAVAHPLHETERPLLQMIQGWVDYAASHHARFNFEIGDDYVLGDGWFAIGMAMLRLLNGDLGRLDGGTLDTIIRDNLEEQGFDCDSGERRKE